MYKVFISDRPLFFLSENESIANSNAFITHKEIGELSSTVNRLERGEIDGAIFQGDAENWWKKFKTGYKLIEAAGGVVKNEKHEMLFILRLGKWDLPKGKIEKGEEIKEAAIREVEEECGIGELTIVSELSPTYHTYSLKGQPILKRTHWFLMQTSDDGELIPQFEEDIEKAVWVNENDLTEQMTNTYNSIRDVLLEIKTTT